MRVCMLMCVVFAGSLLTACGQRGALYIPGKPGDPYYDKQNRGSTPPGQTSPSNSTKPAPQPRREDDPTS